MKDNNISIYLRKDTYEKYKELTELLELPLSSFIAQMLQTPDQLKVIDDLIKLTKLTKDKITHEERQ